MLCAAGTFLRSVSSMELEVPAALRSQIVAEFDPAQIGDSETRTASLANRFLGTSPALLHCGFALTLMIHHSQPRHHTTGSHGTRSAFCASPDCRSARRSLACKARIRDGSHSRFEGGVSKQTTGR